MMKRFGRAVSFVLAKYAAINDAMNVLRVVAFIVLNGWVISVVFALISVLGYYATQVPESKDWTNWVIPIVVIVGAFGMTQAYPARVRDRARPTG